MLRKIVVFLVLCLLPGLAAFAQDLPAGGAPLLGGLRLARENFWVCPGAEFAMFSLDSAAFGGGLSLGYGNRAAIGLKAVWFGDANGQVTTMELNVLFRWYVLRPSSWLYVQFNGGPAFFAENEGLSLPSELGAVSAGLSLGWRQPIGRYWFAEAAIRAGYPYIVGGGLFFGFTL